MTNHDVEVLFLASVRLGCVALRNSVSLGGMTLLGVGGEGVGGGEGGVDKRRCGLPQPLHFGPKGVVLKLSTPTRRESGRLTTVVTSMVTTFGTDSSKCHSRPVASDLTHRSIRWRSGAKLVLYASKATLLITDLPPPTTLYPDSKQNITEEYRRSV
ncbi:hypothetical protein EVAR_13306_1 [Eumeta japonica]|uniref:Uncharacterized protein n=1 Tax=Eumeta variegata TaxID=151549 RepID=A0A4C1TRQ4_EUMVA|nr:hypothetical protein EVAR_13306_1 [Eumeta japonica]